MKYTKLLPLYIIVATIAALFSSCIEDGVSSSSSDQPAFSVDTLDLGTVFTDSPTPTYSFLVYNRNSKVINISSVSLRDPAGTFRINVDGQSGRSFSNIEVRPNDSIYVFVEATVPHGSPDVKQRRVTDHIDFVTQGVTRSVVVAATGRDVEVLKGLVIDSDTRWDASRPRQIFDSLVVAEGATLTLDPGVELFFHDKATLEVRGRLHSLGSVESPVVMTGDRTDNVVADIPFDLMASQWGGVTFHTTSSGSTIEHTVIKNMSQGVYVDSVPAPGLFIRNSRIRNSAGYAFAAWFSDVEAVGTEFSDAGLTPLLLVGGNHLFNHCTVANYYLFSAIAYPLLNLGHFNSDSAVEDVQLPYMKADFSNCIFYGLGDDINTGNLDDTDVYIRSSVFKSAGSDDDHFISSVWDTDPLYLTVRDDYLFDYRLRDDSPVLDAGDGSLTLPEAATDFYGTLRAPDPTPGAFQHVMAQ